MTSSRPPGPTPVGWLDPRPLTDASRCPACAARLAGQRCPACGLDVTGPRGKKLWELSQEAAAVLARREGLIATMRSPVPGATPVRPAAPLVRPASAWAPPGPVVPASSGPQPVERAVQPPDQRPAPQEAAQTSAPPTPHPAARPTTGPTVPPTPQPSPVPGQPTGAPGGWPGVGHLATGPAAPPRPGWALQTILLVLGATLLAGASVVFLVFTWGLMPLPVRATIVVAITGAVFTGAHLAARAGLRSSAEAIAALGSVLLVLDVWALWATVLSTAVSGPVFMAGGLLVCAGVLVPLGRALTLTAPAVSGFGALVLAPSVLALAAPSPAVAAVLVTGTAALCLVGRAPQAPAPVRPVLVVLAPLALALAGLRTLESLLVDGPGQATAGFAALALVCGLWAWSTSTEPAGRAWSAAAGATLGGLGLVGAAALGDPLGLVALWWLLPLGALAALAVTLLALRALPRLPATAGQAGWGVVTLAAALPALAVAAWLARVVSTTAVVDTSRTRDEVAAALLGLALVAGTAPLLRVLGSRVATTAGAADGREVPAAGPAAPPVLGGPWTLSLVAASVLLLGLPLVAVDLLVAVALWAGLAAVLALATTRLAAGSTRPVGRIARTCAVAVTLLALLLAAVLSFSLTAGAGAPAVSATAGEALLAATFAVAALVLGVARGWVPATELNRATLLGASLVIASAAVGIAAQLVLEVASVGWYAAALPLLLVLLALSARDLGTAGRAQGRGPADGQVPVAPLGADRVAALVALGVVLTPGVVVVATTVLPLQAGDPLPALASSLLAAVTVLLATVLVGLVAFARRSPAPDWVRTVGGALGPVLVVVLALSLRPLALLTDGPPADIDWTLVVLGLLAVLLVVVGAGSPSWAGARTTSVASTVCLLVAALTLVVAQGEPGRVVVALTLSSAATLAYAVSSGRHAWAWGALPLAVCASWVGLGTATVTVPEAYTAPGAVVLVVVAVWQLRTAGRSTTAASPAPSDGPLSPAPSDGPLSAAGRLLLAGATLLVGPTAVLAPWTREETRTAVVLLAVLALAAASATPAARRLRVALGLAWIALVTTVVGLGGRSLTLAATVGTEQDREIGPVADHPAVLMTVWTLTAVALTVALALQIARLLPPGGAWAGRRPGPVAGAPTPLPAQDPAHAPAAGAGAVPVLRAGLAADPRVWAPTLTTALLTAPVAVLVLVSALGSASPWVVTALVLVWGATALLGTPPGWPRVRSRTEFLARAVPALVGTYLVALLGVPSGMAGVAASVGGDLTGGIDDTGFALLALAGLAVAVVGIRATQVERTTSTWTTLTAGVLATVLPLTAAMLAAPAGWKVVAATVVAGAWVVLGVSQRWQAPVALGALALALQTLALAGPPALAALAGVEGWVVLAVVGGVLLVLGLSYERQITLARSVLRRYADLR